MRGRRSHRWFCRGRQPPELEKQGGGFLPEAALPCQCLDFSREDQGQAPHSQNYKMSNARSFKPPPMWSCTHTSHQPGPAVGIHPAQVHEENGQRRVRSASAKGCGLPACTPCRPHEAPSCLTGSTSLLPGESFQSSGPTRDFPTQ